MGGFTKNQYRREGGVIVEKGGLGQFVNLRRDLARKREGVFEGRGGG